MAKYIATVNSKKSALEAFEFLANLENLEIWDPGVSSAKLASGSIGGADATYNVTANSAKILYEITDHSPGEIIGFRGKTKFFESIDKIFFKETDEGCQVTYDAILLLNGPLRILDFFLSKFLFNKIGDKAAVGLAKHLDGEVVEK